MKGRRAWKEMLCITSWQGNASTTTPSRMADIFKPNIIKAGEEVKQMEIFYTAGRKAVGKSVWKFLKVKNLLSVRRRNSTRYLLKRK